MNSPIILRISHISGIPYAPNASITLTRDALLDHEMFEQYLTPEQFAWLVNVRCSVRYRSTGMTASWWLQHGSHQYTCSINDQLIACSDSVPLHTGDRIEIGMIRLEVMGTDSCAPPVQPPLLPVIPSVFAENETTRTEHNDLFAEIPLLTDIVDVPVPAIAMASAVVPVTDRKIDDNDTHTPVLNNAMIEEIHHDQDDMLTDTLSSPLFDMVPDYVMPVDTSPDDVFSQLEAQFNDVIQHPGHITSASWPHTEMSSHASASSNSRDTDFSLSDLADLHQEISDDLSLEEALLGPLSVHQALSHLQVDDDIDEENETSAVSVFDLTENEKETDVLSLFSDTAALSNNTSSTQHIHQSFPDSFCDMSTETTSLALDDTLSPTEETR